MSSPELLATLPVDSAIDTKQSHEQPSNRSSLALRINCCAQEALALLFCTACATLCAATLPATWSITALACGAAISYLQNGGDGFYFETGEHVQPGDLYRMVGLTVASSFTIFQPWAAIASTLSFGSLAYRKVEPFL